MRLLSLYYTHKPGGLCKRLYRLLNDAAAAGHEVTYLALDTPPVDLKNVHFIRIPFFTSQRSGALFWLCFGAWVPVFLIYIFWRRMPERVFLFNGLYCLLSKPAAILFGVPQILFLRALSFKVAEVKKQAELSASLLGLIDRLAIACSKRAVVLTPSMQRDLQVRFGTKASKLALLSNDLPILSREKIAALDFSQLGIPGSDSFNKGEPKLIVCAGVFDRRKNGQLLLEALKNSKCWRNASEWSMLFVGNGSELSTLEHFARESGIQRVYFLGWREDLAKILNHAALLVHPSLHEGMSNVILEALAFEVPVICSDVPEQRDLFKYDELLFDSKDARSLAQKLDALITNQEELEILKKKCSIIAAELKFDWSAKALELILA